MCIFLLAAGLTLLQPETASQAARVGPVVLFIYLFTIAYSLGEGPVAFQYSAEVFPTIQRGPSASTTPSLVSYRSRSLAWFQSCHRLVLLDSTLVST